MRFVSRRQWGARKPKARTRIPGPVLGVTLHWEGPHMGRFPHSRCDNLVRGIQDFHMDTRGWADIAYSAILCPHGWVFEGRGVGIRTAANGVSSIGGNDRWYALCYLSGEGDPFTDDAKQAFKDGVAWLREAGGAGDRVNGHRDHHATVCPGDVIYHWLNHTDWTDMEDDMPTAKEIAEAVLKLDAIPSGHKDNPNWSLETFVRNIEFDGDRQNRWLQQLLAQMKAQRVTIDKLVDALGSVKVIDPAELAALKQSIHDGIVDAVNSIDVEVTAGED